MFVKGRKKDEVFEKLQREISRVAKALELLSFPKDFFLLGL
jgi:hypothetical protein